MNNRIVVFFDLLGRTILGEFVEENKDELVIKNPAVIHVQPDVQNGRLSLQALPLFFREFQADKSEGTVWRYKKQNITQPDSFELDFRVEAQYRQLFAVNNTAAQIPQTTPLQQPEPKVVKLFDE